MFKRLLPRLGILGLALCFTAEVLTAFEVTTEALDDVLAFNSHALVGDENWAKVEHNVEIEDGYFEAD
jgi:hypothetical protein